MVVPAPAIYCSSRHMMSFDLKNEGPKRASMMWRARSSIPYMEGDPRRRPDPRRRAGHPRRGLTLVHYPAQLHSRFWHKSTPGTPLIPPTTPKHPRNNP